MDGNEKIARREHREDSKQWGHRVVSAMRQYNHVKDGGPECLAERAKAFAELLSLAKEKVDLGYNISDIDPFGVSDFTDEDRKMIWQLCKKVKRENENER